MLGWYPRPQARSDASDDHGEVELVDGYNVFYGIVVVCLSIFLFCVFAASFSVWKALAFTALAALLLGVAGCFLPTRWFRRRRTTTELVVTVRTTPRPRPPGCALALANAPPAFAFECPLQAGGEPAAAAATCVVCSVCLEDVRGGEMVRQVPACRHIFHVECIDMWLHSHRTCPLCRSVITPPPAPKGSSPAAEEAPHQSSAEELPPV